MSREEARDHAERLAAHALLESMDRTTPGGIRREQFVRRGHPVKTVLAIIPFVALVAAAAFAIITR
ncbi:MAG TPA: hypothetical protein VFN69_04505 [Rudaea sp.]|nr:hypothetical protein [Rudaea sp.]